MHPVIAPGEVATAGSPVGSGRSVRKGGVTCLCTARRPGDGQPQEGLAQETDKEERPMQHENTGSQRMVSVARRRQAVMRRGGAVGVLAALLLLPLGVGAVGSGDLDSSFGSNGTVTTSFGGSSFAAANAIVIQSDGKIVGAGAAGTTSGNRDFALARYLPNGSLDPSFGGDGTVLTNFGSGTMLSPSPWPCSPMARLWWPARPTGTSHARTLPWRAICPMAPWTPASAAMAR